MSWEKLTNRYLCLNAKDYYSNKDTAILSGPVKHPSHHKETDQYLSDIPAYISKPYTKKFKTEYNCHTAVLILYQQAWMRTKGEMKSQFGVY